MNDDLTPGIGTKEKKMVIFIIALAVAAAGGWIGYSKVMQWHKHAIDTAVSEQQQIMAEKRAALEHEILDLRNKLQTMKPAPVPDHRMAEVFGDLPESGMGEPDLPCSLLKQKIDHFFDYLKHNTDAGNSRPEQVPADIYRQMILALAANPPMIVDEMRDIVSLKHNLAHFYRVLKNDRIKQVKNILSLESDVLEHAMADFYTYYVSGDASGGCCANKDETPVSLNTLYEYAAFFTNTIAGRSYLFRRRPAIRSLMNYYSTLILDRANEAGINRYGIDIRPYIDIAIDTIASRNDLVFQDQYLEKLTQLQEKYSS